MARAHKPRIVAGLLVGALLTAPLIAVLYAAWGLIGLPFVPYDMFDLMARVLPGRVITSGIDMMVTVIRTLDIGPTSVVAKAAEHALAIGGLFITGVIAGGVLFGVLRMVDVRRAYGVGFAASAGKKTEYVTIALFRPGVTPAGAKAKAEPATGGLILPQLARNRVNGRALKDRVRESHGRRTGWCRSQRWLA